MRSKRIPSYSLHKASGKAVVRLSGRDHYLGPYGTPDSHEAYNRLIAEWLATQRSKQPTKPKSLRELEGLLVVQLIERYRAFAMSYYVKDGKPTKEFENLKYALKPLRELYGSTPASEYGPKNLKAMQGHFIEAKICRTQINKRIDKIKRMFKWAVSEELVPPSVLEGLRSVNGLRYGRTQAVELPPVTPIDDHWVDATLPFMSNEAAAMVQLQRLAGMRPQDVVAMRLDEIDRTGPVWVYSRQEHKNRWRGHDRNIYLGPKAQTILAPFISDAGDSAFLFSPKRAEERRNAVRKSNRKSKITPSQLARKPKPNPKRAKRDCYDVCSYRRAIKYAIKLANKARKPDEQIPDWFPLQLRHSCATQIRKVAGLEAAQVTLGHARADITQIYAERDQQLALQVAQNFG